MGKKFEQSNQYELMVAFYFSLGTKGFEEELATVREEITSHSGKIFFENIWGKRDLLYKIKRQDQAYYVVLDFTIERDDIIKLKRELDLNQKILRYLLVKLPADYQPKASYEPFFLVEPKEKKEEKIDARGAKPVRKAYVKPLELEKVEEVAAEAAPAIEEVEEVVAIEMEKEIPIVEPPAKPKATKAAAAEPEAKGKKADPNFDQKLDEIIENLDNL